MNNKEQTAVEWFFMTMNICGLLPTEEIVEYYNQAKEMEKERIIKAAQDNFYAGQDLAHGYAIKWNTAEDYYNKTYGDKK